MDFLPDEHGNYEKGVSVVLTRPVKWKGQVVFSPGETVWIVKGYEHGSLVPITDGNFFAIARKADL